METTSEVRVPRVVIRFCTQCKWNLRAAYYAQELLQTFSTTLGEVALIPMAGGVFDISLYHAASTTVAGAGAVAPSESKIEVQKTLVWDRKRDGGFPETKELKNRVRNLIDPERDMGHIDRRLHKDKEQADNVSGIGGQLQGVGAKPVVSDSPVAAGGENPDFGNNIHPNAKDGLYGPGVGNSVKDEEAARNGGSQTKKADCEDCK